MNWPPGFRSKTDTAFAWESRFPAPGWLLLGVAVVVICSYLLYMSDQDDVESRFASDLARRLQWYPLEFPDAPITNLAQVLYGSRGGYPYQWHEWFRVYGTNAGFARSLAEKYVMVPSGVSLGRGEFYLVSAQPFSKKGNPYRTVIYKQTNDFGASAVGEAWVRKAFQDAGNKIPTASMATPPPSPSASTTRNAGHYYLSSWLETRGLFSRLEWWGMAPAMARVVEKACYWGLGLACVYIIGYCLLPVASKRREGERPPAPQLTTAQKIWSVIGWTLLFFLVLGFMSPGFGSDRGYGQLFFHVLLPYLAGWEAMRHQGASGNIVAGILLFGQIGAYDFALSYAWIRNRLRSTAIILTFVHLFAIVFSIWVVLSRS